MTSPADQRQYVRMSTVIPVEMQKTGPDGTETSSSILQAFTRDVSAGGMRLEIKSFGAQTEALFKNPGSFFKLTINPPFTPRPIHAIAKVVWSQREDKFLPVRYDLGVTYTHIDAKARRRIIGYARKLIWVPRLAALLGLALLLLLGQASWKNHRILEENRRLVSEMVLGAQNRSEELSRLNELNLRKETLEKELLASRQKMKLLEDSLADAQAQTDSQRAAFERSLAEIAQRQEAIIGELDTLRQDRRKAQQEAKAKQDARPNLDVSIADQMIGWLATHQNRRTGLVASFEGDAQTGDIAFTYDQALACQAFLLFNKISEGEAILQFYAKHAKKREGMFFNAYGTRDGSVTENVLHAGPNLWLGLAAAQYENKLQTGRFLGLAESIGQWAMNFQDAEGGLRGGPDDTWYSTEHNLDAYALFGALYQLTHEGSYKIAQEKSLAWIQKYAYTASEKRMNRGKGDSTIATDTFSWAVASIGPKKLIELGFDPEAIMDFAKEHCEVTCDVSMQSGPPVKVTGFDFAKPQNIGRGGVISTEWTAQVIVSYQVLADYFGKQGDDARAAAYSEKASFYLNELQKLIITSPSPVGQGRGCLPYASLENVDTGHGWRTPRGRTTGSVAGTAYGLFAWKAFNPFVLEEES